MNRRQSLTSPSHYILWGAVLALLLTVCSLFFLDQTGADLHRGMILPVILTTLAGACGGGLYYKFSKKSKTSRWVGILVYIMLISTAFMLGLNGPE